MTAGPTPVPPAVSQAMAAPMLYHRSPAFDELYERVLGRLPGVFATANPVLAFSASGSGALESAVANLVRPGTECARARRRQVRRALDRALRGLRRRADHAPAGLGRPPGPGRDRPRARAEPGRRGRVRHAQRDLDRHRARHPGDRRGRAPPRRAAGRRRRVGRRRRAHAAGRVGRRRGRRGLAEGADDAARPGVRLGLRARARGRATRGRAAASTSTGAGPRRARRRARARSRPPSRSSSASTSRSG